MATINGTHTLWHTPLCYKNPSTSSSSLFPLENCMYFWRSLYNDHTCLLDYFTHSRSANSKEMGDCPVLTWGSKAPQCYCHSLFHRDSFQHDGVLFTECGGQLLAEVRESVTTHPEVFNSISVRECFQNNLMPRVK